MNVVFKLVLLNKNVRKAILKMNQSKQRNVKHVHQVSVKLTNVKY